MYKAVKRILKHCMQYKLNIVFAFFSAVFSVIASICIPVYIGEAIDCIAEVENIDYNKIGYYLLIIGALILVGVIFKWTMDINTQNLAIKVTHDLKVQAFNRLNSVPISYIDKTKHGDIISRLLNDANQVSDGLQQALTQFLPGILTILGTLGIMYYLNPIIATVVVVITPLSIFVATFITSKSRSSFIEKAKIEGEISFFVNERFQNASLVKIFGNEEKSEKHLKNLTDNLYKIGLKAQFYSSIANPCTRFVNSIVYVAVCLIGAFSVMGNMAFVISIGQLSAFLAYANQYTKPFNEISDVIAQLQIAAVSADRLFALIDEKIEEEKENNKILENCKGNISFKNVSFSYTKEKEFIKNFNLEIKQGQKIAIVGPTGAGKTTLINLLMRFYDVNLGEILIDGINIKNINRNSLRNLYGMVLQDTWLSYGSVNDNISYADTLATKEEIKEVAKQCYAHSFIKHLPQGYDTILKANGSNLSAGQKQLLSIARIMLSKPQILLLDESTSNIDTRTELLIGKVFDKVMKNRTSIVVAHRLSTIQSADIILVVNDGDVIEQGSHKELIKRQGFYYNLFNSQFAKI